MNCPLSQHLIIPLSSSRVYFVLISCHQDCIISFFNIICNIEFSTYDSLIYFSFFNFNLFYCLNQTVKVTSSQKNTKNKIYKKKIQKSFTNPRKLDKPLNWKDPFHRRRKWQGRARKTIGIDKLPEIVLRCFRQNRIGVQRE